MKALLLETSTECTGAIQSLLASTVIEVLACKTLHDAENAIKQHDVDVLLLDRGFINTLLPDGLHNLPMVPFHSEDYVSKSVEWLAFVGDILKQSILSSKPRKEYLEQYDQAQTSLKSRNAEMKADIIKTNAEVEQRLAASRIGKDTQKAGT